MAVELNHIIIPVPDKHAAAAFLAHILGVEVGQPWGPFIPITLSNGVTLDYMNSTDYRSQHCAFLVSEPEFDAAYQRINDSRIMHWADPFRERPGDINHLYGGRGIYFEDPAGHHMEIITQPYGPTPEH